MEFHVWDFSDNIEVRLNDAYIEKIRSLTVEKQVRIQDRRGRDFLMTKKVKLIAFREGHPYHKIAERLYAKTDWHGPGRPIIIHRPFITIQQFLKVHKITGFALKEMERSIIEVRNHWAGHKEIPMRFPVVANEDWAWLLGLWYSCGGKITRHRIGKGGYPSSELTVRYTVDVKVYEKKVFPLLQRIGYIPRLGKVWYVKKGLTHPLDKERRKGVGNEPKSYFTLLRPMREIMEKFGLPKGVPNQRERRGSKYGVRRFSMTVSDWIQENPNFSHAFMEGFLNGSQIGSEFAARQKDAESRFLKRSVELRFAGFNEGQVETFAHFFRTRLEEMGITSYTHRGLHRKTSKAYWVGLLIHNQQSLRRLFEKFDIRKPELRARLVLNHQMNLLVYQICKGLNSSEILILGALLEKPMSMQDLVSAFRMRKETVMRAVEILEHLSLVKETNGFWTFHAEVAILNDSFQVTRLQPLVPEVKI